MAFRFKLRAIWQGTIGKPKDHPLPEVKISQEAEKAAVRARVLNVTQKLAEIPLKLMEEERRENEKKK